MATIPTMTGPRVAASGAGQIAAPPQPYLDAGIAGTPAGQGAAIATGLRSLGQDVGQMANDWRAEALKEQALVNEAMARDADSIAATSMANAYNEYASLEGENAVAKKAEFMARMDEARKSAVATMPNPEAKRMLDTVVTRRSGFYQESIGRYAAQQQKAWQVRSAQGAARVAQDQAATFRYDPARVDEIIGAGVNNIWELGGLRGYDEKNIQADAAKYRGDAYENVIKLLLADNKTDEATTMFERVRGRLDAQSQAQIAQALKPAQTRQRIERGFDRAMNRPEMANLPPDANARAEIVAQEFLAMGYSRAAAYGLAANAVQESGANPSPGRGDGGRSVGLFQWNDSRRAAFRDRYGKEPDEATVREQVQFADWELNNTERRAGDAVRGAQTPEDAARLASTLFLRPRDTAAEEPRRAAIATRLAGVPARPGDYASARPDFTAARERAAQMFGDDPETLPGVLSRIGQAETQYNSTTKADRDTMNARLNDVQAALSDGRAVAIPEVEIRRLYPKEQADEIVGKLGEAQQLGYAMQAVALASPAEFTALRAQYEDVGRPGEQADETVRAGYAQRAKVRETLVRAWQQRNEQIKKDPAAYAGRSPAVAAAMASGDPEAYARAVLGEQERLGVAEADRRTLPKDVTAGLVEKVVSADPEKVPAALVLGELGKQYGAMWPAVFRDMVRSGLPEDYAILGSMSHPDQVGARADAQRMASFVATKGGEKALREAVGDTMKAKTIDDGLDARLSEFYETARFATRGPASRESMRSFVKNMAYYYAGQGASASQALNYAVNGVLKAKYDFDGTMRVPKGQLDLAREVTTGIQARLTDADLAPVAEGPIAAEQRASLAGVARGGFWVPNADDTGLVLYGRYKVMATGIPVPMPVKRADGNNVEVRFNQMDAIRNTQRVSPLPPSGSVMPGLTQALEE